MLEELQKKHRAVLSPIIPGTGSEIVKELCEGHAGVTLQTVVEVLEKLRKPDGKFLGKRIDDTIEEYNTYLQSQKDGK